MSVSRQYESHFSSPGNTNVVAVAKFVQKYERIEYRGDWSKQFHKTEIVGCPGRGVPVAFFEANKE